MSTAIFTTDRPTILDQHKLTFNNDEYILIEVHSNATDIRLFNYVKEYVYTRTNEIFKHTLPWAVDIIGRVDNNLDISIVKNLLIETGIPLNTQPDAYYREKLNLLIKTKSPSIIHVNFVKDYILCKRIELELGEYAPTRKEANITELSEGMFEDFLNKISNLLYFTTTEGYTTSFKTTLVPSSILKSYREVFLNRKDLVAPLPILKIYNDYTVKCNYYPLEIYMIKIHDYLINYNLIQKS